MIGAFLFVSSSPPRVQVQLGHFYNEMHAKFKREHEYPYFIRTNNFGHDFKTAKISEFSV